MDIQFFYSLEHSTNPKGSAVAQEVECLTQDRGRGFEPYRRHCVVVLEQDTFILA